MVHDSDARMMREREHHVVFAFGTDYGRLKRWKIEDISHGTAKLTRWPGWIRTEARLMDLNWRSPHVRTIQERKRDVPEVQKIVVPVPPRTRDLIGTLSKWLRDLPDDTYHQLLDPNRIMTGDYNGPLLSLVIKRCFPWALKFRPETNPGRPVVTVAYDTGTPGYLLGGAYALERLLGVNPEPLIEATPNRLALVSTLNKIPREATPWRRTG